MDINVQVYNILCYLSAALLKFNTGIDWLYVLRRHEVIFSNHLLMDVCRRVIADNWVSWRDGYQGNEWVLSFQVTHHADMLIDFY